MTKKIHRVLSSRAQRMGVGPESMEISIMKTKAYKLVTVIGIQDAYIANLSQVDFNSRNWKRVRSIYQGRMCDDLMRECGFSDSADFYSKIK